MKNEKNIEVRKSKIHGNGVFATRDIKKGEEITADYIKENCPEMNFKCKCGSKNCRKIIKT